MKPTILLVDDDPDDIMLLREAITAANDRFNFLESADGRHALNYLRSLTAADKRPCLIVLDVNMPVMDGKEMLAILKSDPELKTIPIIFFTTSSNPADHNYAKLFGVEMLTKPFDMTLMAVAAKRIVEHCDG